MNKSQKLLQKAIALFNDQKLNESKLLLNKITEVDKNNPIPFQLLAFISINQNDIINAIKFFKCSLLLNPNDAITNFNLAEALTQNGLINESLNYYRKAIELNPDNINLYLNLSRNLCITNEHNSALRVLNEAIELNPNFYEAYFNKAKIYYELNDFSTSINLCFKSLEINSYQNQPYQLLGNCYFSLKDFNNALKFYNLSLNFGNFDINLYYQIAYCHFKLNNYENAKQFLHKLILIKPTYIQSFLLISDLYISQSKFKNAIDLLENYLNINSTNNEYMLKLAFLYKEYGKLNKALVILDDLNNSNSKNYLIYYYRGIVYFLMNNINESINDFKKAIELSPNNLILNYCLPFLRIQKITFSFEHLLKIRFQFFLSFFKMRLFVEKQLIHSNIEEYLGVASPFYLSYHELSNFKFYRNYGTFICNSMKKWYDLNFSSIPPRKKNEIPHIAIISSHVKDHAVWHAITYGLINSFLNKNVKVIVFSLNIDESDEINYCINNGIEVVKFNGSLKYLVTKVLDTNLDCIIYPEVGMHQLTIQLAALRLAPIQILSWGHPETSGFKSIDYFLSAKLFDADNSSNYVEKLILFNNLGSYFKFQNIPHCVFSLGEKLEKNKIIISPGNLIKYSPKYDYIYLEILKACPNCVIVFFYENEYIKDIFYNRITSFADNNSFDCLSRFVFLPWLTPQQFNYFLSKSFIFLDSPGFSGFNTVMQAIENDLPVVSLKGKFLRSNFGAGILKHLSLDELIAINPSQIINICCKLVLDNYYYINTRKVISANKDLIFNDDSFLDDLYKFVTNKIYEFNRSN